MSSPVLSLSPENILAAVQALAAGKVIGFATETVFGIGADARNPKALQAIYELKGRPAQMPLQLLVSNRMSAENLADFSLPARKVASVFWPGALTLIVPPKNPAEFPPQAVSGQGIGLRVPNHAVTLEILKAFDAPIAASSANLSGKPAATTAKEVLQSFGAGLALILDGTCEPAGKASTVVDASGETPKILREGAISTAQILAVWG